MRCRMGFGEGLDHGRNLQIEPWLVAAGDDRVMAQSAKDPGRTFARYSGRGRRVSAKALVRRPAASRWCSSTWSIRPRGPRRIAGAAGGNATGIGRSEYGASTMWPEMLKLIRAERDARGDHSRSDAATDYGQIAVIQDIALAVGIEAFALDADSLRDLERAIVGLFADAEWRPDRHHSGFVDRANRSTPSAAGRALQAAGDPMRTASS